MAGEIDIDAGGGAAGTINPVVAAAGCADGFKEVGKGVFAGAAFADCAAFVQCDRLPQAGVIDSVATGAKGVGVIAGAGEHDVVTAIAAQDVATAIAFEPVSGIAAIDVFKVLNIDADRANTRQVRDRE